jgi:hypothetical protein
MIYIYSNTNTYKILKPINDFVISYLLIPISILCIIYPFIDRFIMQKINNINLSAYYTITMYSLACILAFIIIFQLLVTFVENIPEDEDFNNDW